MDKNIENLLTESVKRILQHADMELMTESKVRKLAAEDTGIDLEVPANRKLVKRIINDYFVGAAAEQAVVAVPEIEERKEPAKAVKAAIPSKPATKEKRRVFIDQESEESSASEASAEEGDSKNKQIVTKSEDEEEEPGIASGKRRFNESEEDSADDGSDEEMPAKKQGKWARNDTGDIIVCQLAPKRSVTIQEFKGKLLVSIREYYEKDGKQLPTQKGLSLSVEQWEAFKNGIPDIEAAIQTLQG